MKQNDIKLTSPYPGIPKVVHISVRILYHSKVSQYLIPGARSTNIVYLIIIKMSSSVACQLGNQSVPWRGASIPCYQTRALQTPFRVGDANESNDVGTIFYNRLLYEQVTFLIKLFQRLIYLNNPMDIQPSYFSFSIYTLFVNSTYFLVIAADIMTPRSMLWPRIKE